jgi:hypothetical protein
MNIATRIKIEKQIVRAIVNRALASGWSVSVHDSEEWTIKKSLSTTEIMKAIMTTDEDVLRFHDADGVVGIVSLVYGNDGWDVVSDHSANDRMEAFMEPISELSDKLCLKYA